MAFAEGGIFAALIMAFGAIPKRAQPPQMLASYPVIEAEPDTSEAIILDVSETPAADVSDGQTSPPAKLASTRAFVRWWRTLDDVPAWITQRYLIALYAEFCELENLIPLSDRQLVNAIKKHGVESDRPAAKIVNGKQRRPTLYHLKGKRS